MSAPKENERTKLMGVVPHWKTVLANKIPPPNPKTGLVHCMLERSSPRRGLLGNAHSPFMTLRLDHGKEEESRSSTGGGALLQAQAVSAHRFTITTAPDANVNNSRSPQPLTLATLTRVQSNMTCITYGLYNAADNDALMAVILYSVPNLTTFLSSPPPRRAQMALLSNEKYKTNLSSTTAKKTPDSTPTSPQKPQTLEAMVRDSIQQNGSLEGLRGLAGVTAVLTSVEPYLKSHGSVGLNFRGRGREASPKNMQLAAVDGNSSVKPSPPNMMIHAQMVKWDTDQYHLDYYSGGGTVPPGSTKTAPSSVMNALTTFAFGLAQMDL